MAKNTKAMKALEAFANMGDRPEDWADFRQRYQNFFPTVESSFSKPGFRSLTEWLYTSAENLLPAWEILPPAEKERVAPPLILYRNLLRSAWSRSDSTGHALVFLLGFEKDNLPAGYGVIRPMLIPGQSTIPGQQETEAGLPKSRPKVNPATGEIGFEFGCDFQNLVYELLCTGERWRAMVCSQCGKYFVATKSAQKHCSPQCYLEFKRKRSLDYWNRKGKKIRHQKTAARRRKHGKK